MKNNFKIFLCIGLIISLVTLGACTKKEKDPEPSSSFLYFKGKFGNDTLNYKDNINNWYNAGYGGGRLVHINSIDKYIYCMWGNTYWQTSNSPNNMSISFTKIKFDASADYKPSESDFYEIWKSGPVKNIPSYMGFSQGWYITYVDEKGNLWTNNASNNNYIYIYQNRNTYTNGKELEVTGYITCALQEQNNPGNTKILKGMFRQIVSNYYENPEIYEFF